MQEELEKKQFDFIAKTEALLETPILIRLIALAFYADFVLHHFYRTSFAAFESFASLRNFVFGMKPLSLALVIAGAALVPRVGVEAWRFLDWLLERPTRFLLKEERKELNKLSFANEIMPVERGIELAQKKRDEYLLDKCRIINEEMRKKRVAKINASSVFSILLINLILISFYQTEAGLIIGSMALQWVIILIVGIYAGTSNHEDYYWVRVPEGYTEEEIHPSRFKLVKK